MSSSATEVALGPDRTFQGSKQEPLGAGKGQQCGAEELMVSPAIPGVTAGDTALLGCCSL